MSDALSVFTALYTLLVMKVLASPAMNSTELNRFLEADSFSVG